MRDVHYRSSSMFLPIVLALLTIVNTLGSGGMTATQQQMVGSASQIGMK